MLSHTFHIVSMPVDQERMPSPLHDPKCVCLCVCIVNVFQIVLTYALCVYYETDACVCVCGLWWHVLQVCVCVRCMVWLCIFGIWGQVFRPCWCREQMWFVLDSEFYGCRFFLFLTFFASLFICQVITLFLLFSPWFFSSPLHHFAALQRRNCTVYESL